MDAGVVETEMPADIHNLNKIEKIYLSQLAEDLCAFIPSLYWRKIRSRKSQKIVKGLSQRKVIHGLISE